MKLLLTILFAVLSFQAHAVGVIITCSGGDANHSLSFMKVLRGDGVGNLRVHGDQSTHLYPADQYIETRVGDEFNPTEMTFDDVNGNLIIQFKDGSLSTPDGISVPATCQVDA